MRMLFTILTIFVIAIAAFIGGVAIGFGQSKSGTVKRYIAPEGRYYEYVGSPGNLVEVVLDKDRNEHPERWVLIAQEDRNEIQSYLTSMSEGWTGKDAFFSRQPGKAFDMAYWDDDGDELFDAFTFRTRGWCAGDACGGSGDLVLTVLDLDTDGQPETLAYTTIVEPGRVEWTYLDIGFDGTWDIEMDYGDRNHRAQVDGQWYDVVKMGNPMREGIEIIRGEAIVHVGWKDGQLIVQE